MMLVFSKDSEAPELMTLLRPVFEELNAVFKGSIALCKAIPSTWQDKLERLIFIINIKEQQSCLL